MEAKLGGYAQLALEPVHIGSKNYITYIDLVMVKRLWTRSDNIVMWYMIPVVDRVHNFERHPRMQPVPST